MSITKNKPIIMKHKWLLVQIKLNVQEDNEARNKKMESPVTKDQERKCSQL